MLQLKAEINQPLTFFLTHLIHLNEQGVDNVMMYQLKVLVADPVLHIPLPSSEEVVHHNDLLALHHESVHKM